jgi:hypothetical protein
MIYDINISENANIEIWEYYGFIKFDCNSPTDAAKHLSGIWKTIRDLRKNPYVSAKQDREILIRYGYGVRRVNFKKMAIIYTVIGDTIYIHRFIAQSMIKGL